VNCRTVFLTSLRSQLLLYTNVLCFQIVSHMKEEHDKIETKFQQQREKERSEFIEIDITLFSCIMVVSPQNVICL